MVKRVNFKNEFYRLMVFLLVLSIGTAYFTFDSIQVNAAVFAEKNSSISSDNVYIGEKVIINSVFGGGIKPYKYKYSIRNSDGSWTNLSDYSDKTSCEIKMPSVSGLYTLRTAAKDAKGAYASKYFNVVVKKNTLMDFSENGSSLSSDFAYSGGTLTAYAKFKGGTEPYKYKYSIRLNGVWKDLKTYSYSDTEKITLPKNIGEYTVRIAAKDVNGEYASKYLTVTVGKNTGTAFKENGSYASKTKASVGESVVLYAKFNGGTQPYTYKYSVKNANGTWNDIKNYSSTASLSVKLPSSIGRVTYRIASKDAVGTYTSKYIYVDVVNKTGKKFEDNGSYVNKSSIYSGDSVTAYAKFKGGTQPYKYKYSYRLNGGAWKDEGGYTDAASKKITLPSVGNYTVRVASLDSNGNYASKYITVKSDKKAREPFKENGSYASKTKASAGESVVLYAKFKGGTQPYTYKYSVRNENGTWNDIKNYSSVTSLSVKLPSISGKVTYRIASKDAVGNYTSKYIYIDVVNKEKNKFEDNGSSVNDDWIYCGSSVTAYAKFKGGTQPYKYKYSYRLNGGAWKDVSGYSDDASKKITLPSVGDYTVRVASLDANDNYASKYLYVKSRYYLPVNNICQYSYPSLPTGCEVTALTCCLNYYGFNISKNTIANLYLPKGGFYYSNGELYGPDPFTTFVGSPTTSDSYGCYSKCIETTANNYLKSQNSSKRAKTVNGQYLYKLFEYLKQGKPVLAWATMNMEPTILTTSWKTPDGKQVTWKGNEHCLVIAGYDPERKIIYAADPMQSTTGLTEYNYDLFRLRYDEQGRNAVIIDG